MRRLGVMNPLSLLALAVALAAHPSTPPSPEAAGAPSHEASAHEAPAPSRQGPDVALAGIGGGVGAALGVPLLYAVAMLTPASFFLGGPLLVVPLIVVLPSPVLAGAVVAVSSLARGLPHEEARARAAIAALGAGGGGLAGLLTGSFLGASAPCGDRSFCSLELMLLGGLGGAIVGGAVGGGGALLLSDGLAARPRSAAGE